MNSDDYSRSVRRFASDLKHEVNEIWEKQKTKEKFIELEILMQARANSRNLMQVVLINRILR